MPQHADIAIIGAGAAGLTAAIFAAERNPSLQIALLDGAKSIGAKILVSGGGRCNVTNQKVTASDYHGNRRIIDRILRRFTEDDTRLWFDALGVPLHTESTGKLFPESNKARTVLNALIDQCQKLSITLLTQHRVQSITYQEPTFVIQHTQDILQAGKVIMATGGQSLPKTGSDGSGWKLLQHLSHIVTPTCPALVPLLLDSSFFHAELSGISHEVTLTTRVNERILDRRTGSLLWTHFGISGPVVLDASRFWLLAHEQGHNVQLHLNSLPESTHQDIETWLIQTSALPGRQTIQALLAEQVPSRVAIQLAKFLNPDLGLTPVNLLQKRTRNALIKTLTNLDLPVTGSRGWNFAEVTAGGVPLEEINPSSMESKKIPGLYVIGEMLDCDGRIGGFNFQWAWSTGYLRRIPCFASIRKKEHPIKRTYMSNYIFEKQSEAREFRRLQLLEAANDPTTIAMLEETEIQSGWKCLELGAGAGSILRWLGQSVGPSGLAVGVDKNTGYLQDFTSAPFQICKGTFLEVDLVHSFDLIHGRYILIHNKSDEEILCKMLSLLKPGGWALFEEPDFTSSTLMDRDTENSQARVNRAICQMFVNTGLDPAYALSLPRKLEQAGFHVERAQSTIHLCPGQSPMANVIGESALVLQQQYCDTGLCSHEDVQEYVRLSQDTKYWTVYHSTTSVIVRKAPL